MNWLDEKGGRGTEQANCRVSNERDMFWESAVRLQCLRVIVLEIRFHCQKTTARKFDRMCAEPWDFSLNGYNGNSRKNKKDKNSTKEEKDSFLAICLFLQ